MGKNTGPIDFNTGFATHDNRAGTSLAVLWRQKDMILQVLVLAPDGRR